MLEINKPQTTAVRNAIDRLRSRMNVGRIIVERRLQLGLTQEEIAKRAGTKQSRISELETLSGNVRFDTLDRIAAALGLEVTLQPRTQALANTSASPTEGTVYTRTEAIAADPFRFSVVGFPASACV